MKLNLPITVPANMSGLATTRFYLHIAQVALTLLTLILVAPIISIEAKYWVSSNRHTIYHVDDNIGLRYTTESDLLYIFLSLRLYSSL
jgi:hypothetical protein